MWSCSTRRRAGSSTRPTSRRSGGTPRWPVRSWLGASSPLSWRVNLFMSSSMPDAVLVLEDGSHFRGDSIGAPIDGEAEVVFNTCMTGYQEIATDPSYRGQMVCMTYP